MVFDRGRTELSDIARRVVWFRSPEETLKDETLFLNHVMIHGLADDIVRTRRHFDDEAFRRALADPHPGIWDRRSWAFWHLFLDMGPAPPVPVRFAELDETLRGFGGPPRSARRVPVGLENDAGEGDQKQIIGSLAGTAREKSARLAGCK